MKVQINFGDVQRSDAVEQYVMEQLEQRVGKRFGDRITRAEVHLRDHNAGKSGVDKLCRIELRPAGRQPMRVGDGWLVYNGEVYNDQELRGGFAPDAFSCPCDTETVARVLDRDRAHGLDRVRGMYAIGWWDRAAGRLTLVRDPLGIKPLYWARVRSGDADAIAFASEPTALFASGLIEPRPDPVTVDAYMTTIRTTLGRRTLFEGAQQVEPGETLAFELAKPEAEPVRTSWWDRSTATNTEDLRAAVRDSVRAHMRSDVPLCSLLSGGIDSTIIASVAAREHEGLRTYCAGAPGAGDGLADDFGHAREAAAWLGVAHHEVPVDAAMFNGRWAWMVDRMGVPLSTPNEVAIHAVAASLRAAGNIVALTGEGAAELFGGYGLPLSQAAAFCEEADGEPTGAHGLFQLRACAWINDDLKQQLLRPETLERASNGAHVSDWYARTFADLHERGPRVDPDEAAHALHTHLRFQRRVNLAGLLGRLDTATMLESVEGRTPLADRVLASVADSIPVREKFTPASDPGGEPGTKLCLRRAFAGELPASILGRPKRSFPLPFQEWMRGAGGILSGSEWLRARCRDGALEAVAADPSRHWNIAWPLTNLALWSRRWGWG